jgi:hypothetical protein
MVDTDIDAIRERARLEDKLTRLWDWLESHKDHPKFAEREQVWINTLRKYERTQDGIERGKARLT